MVMEANYIGMLDQGASGDTLTLHLESISYKVNALNFKEPTNRIKHVYQIEGAYGYSGQFEPRLVEQIRKDPGVAFVEVDTVMYAQNVERGAPWGLARVSRRNALEYSGTNRYFYDARGGENVTAYIIDTGINWKHEDFQGRASWGKTIPPTTRTKTILAMVLTALVLLLVSSMGLPKRQRLSVSRSLVLTALVLPPMLLKGLNGLSRRQRRKLKKLNALDASTRGVSPTCLLVEDIAEHSTEY
ncbi:proteinase B [Entomophthora muscae]|uniref:Proteinase B n=1 Tax=Entomophthora muscae TaxID=34485 RepID=A0ACC2US24_9FUNG|nr:proteinase B [Entomophthora muscae]